MNTRIAALITLICSFASAGSMNLSGKVLTPKGDPIFRVKVASQNFGVTNLTNPSGEWTLVCDSCATPAASQLTFDTVRFLVNDSVIGSLAAYSSVQSGLNFVVNTHRSSKEFTYDYKSCSNKLVTEDSLILVNAQINALLTRGKVHRNMFVMAGIFSIVTGVTELVLWSNVKNTDGTSWAAEVADISGGIAIGAGGLLILNGATTGDDNLSEKKFLSTQRAELQNRKNKFRISPSIKCDF